jgi:hypothetical protein
MLERQGRCIWQRICSAVLQPVQMRREVMAKCSVWRSKQSVARAHSLATPVHQVNGCAPVVQRLSLMQEREIQQHVLPFQRWPPDSIDKVKSLGDLGIIVFGENPYL